MRWQPLETVQVLGMRGSFNVCKNFLVFYPMSPWLREFHVSEKKISSHLVVDNICDSSICDWRMLLDVTSTSSVGYNPTKIFKNRYFSTDAPKLNGLTSNKGNWELAIAISWGEILTLFFFLDTCIRELRRLGLFECFR